MAADVVVRELDHRAMEFAYGTLVNGLALSSSLLPRLSRDVRYWTWAPEHVPSEVLYDFASGILDVLGGAESSPLPTGHVEAVQRVALPAASSFVADYLRQSNCAIAILEDTIREPTGTWLSRTRAPWVQHGKHVLHVLDARDTRISYVQTVLRLLPTWQSVTVLASLASDEPSLRNGQVLTDDEVQMIASFASYLLIGAYDGEGYVDASSRFVGTTSDPRQSDDPADDRRGRRAPT